MAVSISSDWKKKTAEEILDSALPDELLISEINPEFEKEYQD